MSILEEINENILPNALMMGVDYELFWTLNPKTLSPFVKAFDLKQSNIDTMAWQVGVYVRMAIASSLSKGEKYPTKPMMSKQSTVKKEEMSAEEIKSRMMARMVAINSQFGKE